MQKTIIVVPCYNESSRIHEGEYLSALPDSNFHLLFVNDGSTDATQTKLQKLCSQSAGKASLLSLDKNQGKAEAVRLGLLQALASGAEYVGYLDADLATPLSEMKRLVSELEQSECQAIFGSRVALLGHDIQRKPFRHYLGRIFATAASLILGIPVYDTQCGAKVFQASELLNASLSESFKSRWVFDVEIIGRLLIGDKHTPGMELSAFREVPLRAWKDVSGSKISGRRFLMSGLELFAIAISLRKRKYRLLH